MKISDLTLYGSNAPLSTASPLPTTVEHASVAGYEYTAPQQVNAFTSGYENILDMGFLSGMDTFPDMSSLFGSDTPIPGAGSQWGSNHSDEYGEVIDEPAATGTGSTETTGSGQGGEAAGDTTDGVEHSEENTATDNADSTDNGDSRGNEDEYMQPGSDDTAEENEEMADNRQRVPVDSNGQPAGQPVYEMVMAEGATGNQNTDADGDPMAGVEGLFGSDTDGGGYSFDTDNPHAGWSLSDLYQSEFDPTRPGTVTGDHFQQYFGLTGEALANARAELADIANNVPVGEYGERYGINTEGMTREEILNQVYAMVGERYRDGQAVTTENNDAESNMTEPTNIAEENEEYVNEAQMWNNAFSNNNGQNSQSGGNGQGGNQGQQTEAQRKAIEEYNAFKNQISTSNGFNPSVLKVSTYKQILGIIKKLKGAGVDTTDANKFAEKLLDKLASEIKKDMKDFINSRGGVIQFDMKELIKKIANGKGTIHIAVSTEDNWEVNNYSKLVQADGVFEFKAKQQMYALMDKMNKYEIFPKTLSLEGHSLGRDLWGTGTTESDVFKIKDLTRLNLYKFPKGSTLIFGQCGGTGGINDVQQSAKDHYTTEQLKQLKGLTIYARNHTAGFNGSFNNSQTITIFENFIDTFLKFPQISREERISTLNWQRNVFDANGNCVAVETRPLESFKILDETKLNEIKNNIREFQKIDYLSENQLTPELRVLRDSNGYKTWIDMKNEFFERMRSDYNFPVPR